MKWSHTLAPSSKTDGIKMSFMIHFYPSGGTNNKHTWFNGHWYEIFKASFTKFVTFTYRTSIASDLEIHWRRRPSSEHLKWPDWVLRGILTQDIFCTTENLWEVSNNPLILLPKFNANYIAEQKVYGCYNIWWPIWHFLQGPVKTPGRGQTHHIRRWISTKIVAITFINR